MLLYGIIIIILLLIILISFKIEIYNCIIIILCLAITSLVFKYNMSTSLNAKLGGLKNSNNSNKLNIDDLIKRMCKQYPHYSEFKKLFLQNISKVNDTLVTLDDIKHRLKYDVNNPISIGNHIGQRKLLLSEVQFLTHIYESKNDVCYCIYAGSAPGHKTHLLAKLFPKIKFILIDPNKFDLLLVDVKKYHRTVPHKDIVHLYSEYPANVNSYMNKKQKDMSKSDEIDIINFIHDSHHQIFIIEDFMDDKYASLLKKLGPSVFISDIRSNTSGDEDSSPLDIDIYWNTSMMYNWINILKPELSMLKIRLPFYNEKIDMKMYDAEFKTSKQYGIDFKQDYNDFKFKMSKSDLYLQAWSRHASSETRMYIKKDNINNIIEYDIKEIEEKLFYYNCIDRIWLMHNNDNVNRKLGFCKCGDCALENKIWVDYLNLNMGYIKKIDDCITVTNNITSRPLSNVHKCTVWSDMSKNLEVFEKIINSNINTKKKINRFKNQKGQTGKTKL